VCVYGTIVARGAILDEMRVLFLLSVVSFGESSVFSAYNRQFCALYPVLFPWIEFVL
jgi:hypothetical protein